MDRFFEVIFTVSGSGIGGEKEKKKRRGRSRLISMSIVDSLLIRWASQQFDEYGGSMNTFVAY